MRTPHALIIDDNVSNLKVLTQLLSMSGVESTAVQDPAQISEGLQQAGSVDVVFLDLEMPRINGYEAIQILRDYGVDVPIVACTVHTSEMDTARELGFHSFLGKPLLAEKFPDQLSQILNNEPVWDAGSYLD